MQIVQVTYHEEPDGWWAESPDLDGYGAAGATLDEVRRLVREGIPFFLETDEVELDERFPTAVVSAYFEGTGFYVPHGSAAGSPTSGRLLIMPASQARLQAA
jgi:Uncharacterized conserved protein